MESTQLSSFKAEKLLKFLSSICWSPAVDHMSSIGLCVNLFIFIQKGVYLVFNKKNKYFISICKNIFI